MEITEALENMKNDIVNQVKTIATVTPDAIRKEIDAYLKEKALGAPIPETPVSKSTDKELRELVKAIVNRDHAVAKALTGQGDATGGYLVPDDFVGRVDELAYKYGITRQFATQMNMGGRVAKIPKLTSEPEVTWVTEGGSISTGQPAFGITQLNIKDAAIIVPITNDLLEDSEIDITSILGRIFARAFAKGEDYQLFNGDGSVFTGIMNHASVPAVAMPATKTSILNISANDLLNLNAAVHEAAEENSRYFMHRTVLNVIRQLTNGTNGPYLFPSTTIWEYPWSKSSLLPSVTDTAVSKKFMCYGDLGYVYFGKKKDLTLQIADQATVDGVSLFQNNMMAIRAIERVAITIAFPEAFAVLKTAAA